MPLPLKLKRALPTYRERIVRILKTKALMWNVSEIAKRIKSSNSTVRGVLKDLIKSKEVARIQERVGSRRIYYYYWLGHLKKGKK